MAGQRAVNDISPVVVVLFGAIVIIEVIFALAGAGIVGGRMGVGWRVAAIQDYGLSGGLIDWMWARGEWPPEHLIRFVTYPFLHGDFVHMIFAGAIFLAMGKFVGDRFAGWAVAAVFFLSSIVGGLAWGLLTGDQGWLIGAYPAAYGLIGAFTYVLWVSARALGEKQMQAFQLIGFLMLIRVILGLIYGVDARWVAELAGFATGFSSSFVLSPGGFARLREMLRGRGA